MYRIVLTEFKNRIIFSYQDDNIPLELKLFSRGNLKVGTIYFGRVSDVKKNIDASFVELSKNLKGFLPGCNHKVGDMIVVQIEREGTDIKNPMLTEDISIAGEYCVMYLKKGSFKFSSKISGELKKSLKSELSIAFSDLNYMTIIRTNAENSDFDAVKNDINYIYQKIDYIKQYAKSRTKSILYEPDDEWLVAVRNIYRNNLDEIVTDDIDIFNKLSCHGYNLRYYDDDLLPLVKLYSLETRLKEATSKKVWLKCGGFLFIEPTEALVSIDVNTGKVSTGKDKEETILKVNLEAAAEIARQLRLRNLSGIIIADFINMEKASDDAELLKYLRNQVANDPMKTQIHGMTSLGLVEITRMKGQKTLYEQSRFISDDATLSGDERRI